MIDTKKLEIIEIPFGCPEWYKFRLKGLGGSDTSTVLKHPYALKYKSLAGLFNEKIGRTEPWSGRNENTQSGHDLEPVVRMRWEHFDGVTNYLDNIASGTKIRECGQILGYAINPDYPWLFASIDGYIHAGDMALDGVILEKGGIFEAKTITSRASNHWESGLPATYIYQVHHYMLVYEMDYAEIALIKDGVFFSVYPVYRDEELINRIIKETKAFWYDLVVPGKEAWIDHKYWIKEGNIEASEKFTEYIDILEPEPDGGEAYTELINARIRDEEEGEGDEKNWFRAQFDKNGKAVIKAWQFVLAQNQQFMKKDCSEQKINRMNFEKGYISFKRPKGSDNPKFHNGIKFVPDEIEINKLTKKTITELL